MAVTKTFGDVAIAVGDDYVATAEIRRPPNNFFDVTLITALADAYDWLDEHADVAVIHDESAQNASEDDDQSNDEEHG